MFEFTATIKLQTTVDALWTYLLDIEKWWLPSNPEHQGIEILSEDQKLEEGTKILIREKVAGIPGGAIGEVTDMSEHKKITWQSDQARYRFWGIPFTIKEGVSWKIDPTPNGAELSAYVWAKFPATLPGQVMEWVFKNLLNGVKKDYEHAMTELRYIKSQIEAKG